jgi:hypothetical protein
LSVVPSYRKKESKQQLRGSYVLLLLIILYLTAALFPFFVSIPSVPGMGFYFGILTVLIIFSGLEHLNHRIMFPVFGFALIGGLYYFFDNYSAGYDHEDPFVAFNLLFVSTSMYLVIIHKRRFSFKFEKILFNLIFFFIAITSITSIYGLFKYPEAARFMVGTDDFAQVLKYMRLNIGSYRILNFFSIVGPTFIYIYFKLKKSIFFLAIGLLASFAVIMGQITGIILMMLICILLYIIAYYSKSFKGFYVKTIITTVLLSFSNALLLFFIEIILPLVEGFKSIIPKVKELQLLLTDGLSVTASEDLTSILGYYERLEKSWSGFLSSPFTGGEDSGAHHYWVDYLAENGLFGITLWILFFSGFWKLIRATFNEQARIMIFINLIIFIIFGLIKNIVLAQQAVLVFFVFPFLVMKLTENKNGI